MRCTSVFTVASTACLLASAAGCRRLEADEAGVCLEVHKVSGAEVEDGQDETSLQVSGVSPDVWTTAVVCDSLFSSQAMLHDDTGTTA